jgi:hypothetical protein
MITLYRFSVACQFLMMMMFLESITPNFDAFLCNFNDVTIVYAGVNC